MESLGSMEMNCWPRRAVLPGLIVAFALSQGCPPARAADLRVLVDTGTEMPLARFDAGQLSGGIHYELGLALARQLGRRARFVSRPRKRIGMALERGEADLLCMYVPAWLPGSFRWTRPFFPMREVLVSDRSAAAPRRLADVAGQAIGMVLGYQHPEVEQALGAQLVRENGPSNESNLRKMAAGRMHHVLTQQATLDYHQKTGQPLSVHAPLLIKAYQAQCAVSPRSDASLDEIDAAIAALLRDGSIRRMQAQFR